MAPPATTKLAAMAIATPLSGKLNLVHRPRKDPRVTEIRSVAGRRSLRHHATRLTTRVKETIVATTGRKRIPNGVKFSKRTRRGTTAALSPMLKASRSIQSASAWRGKQQREVIALLQVQQDCCRHKRVPNANEQIPRSFLEAQLRAPRFRCKLLRPLTIFFQCVEALSGRGFAAGTKRPPS